MFPLKCSIPPLTIFLLLFNIYAIAQQTDKTVATVGNLKISEQEFKLRYELVPHYTRKQFNQDSSKIDLLNSIIAEKLLSQEAKNIGLDTTEYYKCSIQQIKDIYVRDALYKKYIDSKVTINQNEIQKALSRRSKFLSIRIISAPDSLIIYNYFSQLNHGASFDSIGRISDPVEYDSNKTPLKITYGQMEDDAVEDVLYGLKIGQFSSPVKTTGGWFILRLMGISSEVASNSNESTYNRTIENVIRLRKARTIGLKYLDKFYKNKKATVDSTLFLKLTEKISSILTTKKRNNDFGRDNKLFLDEGNIISILNEFGNSIDEEEIVHISKNPVIFKEYLYSLIIYPILIADPSINSVAYNLMQNLNKYIQYKYLSSEGYKEGLLTNPDVQEETNIWGNDYLAKMLKNKIRDSIHVTDDDVADYYKNNKGIEKVNILEILNNDLGVIETVFKELKAGKDFRELAGQYTQRSWTKDRGGEFGYFPSNSFAEIGQVASRLRINQVYGPVRTDSGYSIVKLIDRKTDSTKTIIDFDNTKDQLKDELMTKEFNKKFYKHIANLAEKYKISINERLLKDIKVLNIPMFTFKYIGFGGRIAALPFLDAWYDWINYVDDKSKIVF
jgi:parvulin-like peptidyl-prolyl isomerase